jgi:hypothetical protein
VCEGACADGAPGDVVLHVDFQALDYLRAAGATPRLQAAALAQAIGAGGEPTLWRSEQRFVVDAVADTPRAHAGAIGEALRTVADALAARLRQAGPRRL